MNRKIITTSNHLKGYIYYLNLFLILAPAAAAAEDYRGGIVVTVRIATEVTICIAVIATG